MKKLIFLYIFALSGLAFIQTGCNNEAPKTDTAKTNAPVAQDSLKTLLQVKKMEIKALTMLQPGYYDSALVRYNQCLAYLNTQLATANNKGLYLLSAEYIQINEDMGTIYDSIHQPKNAIKCAFECVKWARLVHDYPQQIKLDMAAAEKLKNFAATTNDAATRESTFREAEQYAIAAVSVIDSISTNDMEDLRYKDYQLTSKIFAQAGDKKQALTYDKKYRDTYFKIYGKRP
jgi:hypothetical protein